MRPYNHADTEQILEAAREAIRTRPNDAKGYFDLGVACAKLGFWMDAIGAFQRALSLEPDYSNAHRALGFACLTLGRNDRTWDKYGILGDLDEFSGHELFDLLSFDRPGKIGRA